MRILIVDDEAPARERLRRLLGDLGGGYEVAGEAGDGRGALAACTRLEVDLVLLDISMPGMDGLEAAARLAELEPPPAVILVTAFPEYALEAFERRVEDYLVKPVRRERLRAALENARIPSRAQRAALRQTNRRETGRRDKLAATFRGGLRAVPIDEVISLQAEHKYVTVRHSEGSFLLDEALTSLEDEFADLFLRIHRNALVARRRVVGLEKAADGSNRVRLRGCDERLQVSRRHLPDLKRGLRSG